MILRIKSYTSEMKSFGTKNSYIFNGGKRLLIAYHLGKSDFPDKIFMTLEKPVPGYMSFISTWYKEQYSIEMESYGTEHDYFDTNITKGSSFWKYLTEAIKYENDPLGDINVCANVIKQKFRDGNNMSIRAILEAMGDQSPRCFVPTLRMK